ncbi:MAG: RloB family protein, partial [Alphaproteobacteria bacterium]|nr:RloB family protein [Alphaproteobacteria bacterium]
MIVCEGEKTEPNYFKGLKDELKLNGANVEITGKSGSSPKSVAAFAKNLYRKEKKMDNSFDRVYCVFDKDDHSTYPGALKQIQDMEPVGVFHAIPSVPCFEYFLLLHYKYTTQSFANCA